MRLRFTIRDLLWLTLVVALAVAWWMDRRRITEREDRVGTLQQVLSVQRIEVIPIKPAKSRQRSLNDESIERAMRIDAARSKGG